MTASTVPLAEGFAPASEEAWHALVAKTLKGAGVETLVSRSPDGLAILPLYTSADGAPALLTPAPRDMERGWDIRAQVPAPSVIAANAAALEALAGGASSLLLRLDVGDGAGIRLSSAEDLTAVLDRVLVELAPVALHAGFHGPVIARWLGQAAKAAPSAPLALHLDPVSEFASMGASPGPIEAHIAMAASTAASMLETYPKASLFLASGAVVHEAGGSPAWELAFAAASSVAYAKALVAAGLSVGEAFERIVLGIIADAEPLGSISKLRAARVLWARIASACGVTAPPRIEARSSGRMLTKADHWTNLVRLTSAGFAAAIGGADAIVLGCFTDAIGAPDAFALRMARNTQLILMEEAHIGRVADPAAGSWAMERQTNDLAAAAWAAFVKIEAAGGPVAALKSGIVATAVKEAQDNLAAALADRRLRIIGVTDFVGGPPPPPATQSEAGGAGALPDPRLPGPDSACPRLQPIRLEDLAQ